MFGCRYTAAFAQLHNAARADADAAPDVRDPRQNLAASLARLSQVSQHSVMPCQAVWPVRFTMCRSSPAMKIAQKCVAEGVHGRITLSSPGGVAQL